MQKRFYTKEGFTLRDFPTYMERSPKRPRIPLVFFVLLFFVVVVLVGLDILGANSKRTEQQHVASSLPAAQETPLPTSFQITPTIFPSATPIPTEGSLDRSNLHVSVLNGSGEKGAAGQVSSYLSGLGYLVISVGNADSYTYRNVTVLVKKSKALYASLLKKEPGIRPADANFSW